MNARSVALLDLHARADQFRDEASLSEIAAILEDRGHRVRLVRSILAEDPGGRASWLDRLGRFIAEGRFDVVALARVWDVETIEVLRASLGERGTIVRLTAGVAAALDDRFDHVLDVAGVMALLDGDDAPRPSSFERVAPAELRRRAKEAPRNPRRLEAIALPGIEIGGRVRPTITGPMAGCPFLLDATKIPAFAALDLDPSKIQTKGCTFCLDNTGSYAVPSEEAVLDAWLTDLRRIRASSPGAREILLVDERPHPYLPAFFRALLREPELAPIELLFKSRVDWLLEYADSAIPEALALAEESGSVLHLYLVGFESFEPDHLELFNKGSTVEDNIAAIEVMRSLAARFPRSFEYLRHRAHGIVLFTPWTTPETLLENARRMREVRFHELRSETLRTRLRLYPRVPLHALAEREGLLAPSFDGGRPDRAAEQGYDASVPWRFKDARVEAIFRVANDLARAQRGLLEADALEIATRFVLRWPGLAADPEVAWLALREATHTWGAPANVLFAGLGAAATGFDPEIEPVKAGLRSAALKESVPRADAPGLVRAYRAMGFESDVVELHGLDAGTDQHRAGTERAIVAVARDKATLAEVLEAQRAHASTRSAEALRAMGALMGYPPCCTRAFLDKGTQGNNLENERRPFARAPLEPLAPVLHRVGAIRIVPHHLCSPSCEESVRFAEAILALLASVDESAAPWVRREIARPVLFLDYDRRLSLAGAWEGDRFRVDDAKALGDAQKLGFDPTDLVGIEIDRRGARFFLRGGEVRGVGAPFPLLTTPGAPMARVALDALEGAEALTSQATSLEQHAAPLPTLPEAFRPGVRVRNYRILAVRPLRDVCEIVLGAETHSFTVRARLFDPRRPAMVRKGRWAIDVDAPESLPEPARLALGLLIRALPEETHAGTGVTPNP